VNQPAEKREQNLRINLQKEPISLDPRKGNNVVASQVHFMLFEGLLRLNPDMTLSPAQAKSYEVSEDGKTYTFYLADAKWSNGTPVTAQDFEKSWKSMLHPNFPSPDAYLLYPIRKAREAKRGDVLLSEVGITAIDAKTLVVELERPMPHFLQVVASSVFLPINPEIDEKVPSWAGSPKNFISNGPFNLKEWKPNDEMIFEKNPLFRGAHNVALNKIFINIIDREMVALHMYASGYFDLIGAPLSFFPVAIHQDLEKKNLLTFFPVATSKFLAFNTREAPFNNANIRRAFAYAINRKDLVEHITQLKEEEMLNIIPPVLLPGKSIPLLADADLAKAREFLNLGLQELNLTSVSELPPLTFVYTYSEIHNMVAQELQSQWTRALGIRPKLEGVEFKVLHERSETGEFSIGLFSWVADYGDPMNILERFQDCTSHRNYSKWSDEDYNQLIEEALSSTSNEERIEKICQAEKLLIKEMPITGLYHGTYAFLLQPHVKGFAISPLGQIYFDKISLD
jgi:oligopeptide transport system substrate-binding protein